MAEDSKMEELDAGPFGEEGPRNDFCFQVEGKNLFVSKAILSAMSPKFKRFFEKNFAGADQVSVELKDEKYEEILTMLKCMVPHPSFDPVTEKNLEVLLKLGKIYSVRFLQDNCSAFIKQRVKEMKYTDKTSFSYLKMVSKYNEGKVFDGVIDLLIRQVSNLKKMFLADNDDDLSPEIKSRLYRHCLLKFKDSQHRTKAPKKRRRYLYESSSSDYEGTCSSCGILAVCLQCKSNMCLTRICVKCGSEVGCICEF